MAAPRSQLAMEALQKTIEDLQTQLIDLDLKYEQAETNRKELEAKVADAERVASEAASSSGGGGTGGRTRRWRHHGRNGYECRRH